MDMLKKKNALMKVISLAVIISFMMTNLPWIGGTNVYALNAVISISAMDSEASVNPSEIIRGIEIPESIGRVKEAYRGPSCKTIIHVQDAHVNVEAQLNIANIIGLLGDKYAIDHVGVEGSRGEILTAPVASYPFKHIRKAVADYWLREARITGPEYFSIVRNARVRLYGVEDKNLYEKNKNAYLRTLELKKSDLKKIYTLKVLLKAIRNRVYSDELIEIAKQEEMFDRSEELDRYATFLVEKAGKHEIDINKYPQTTAFVALLRLVKMIDFKKAEESLPKYMGHLKKRLRRDEKAQFVAMSLKYRLGKINRVTFYEYLKALTDIKTTDNTKYRNVIDYLTYTINHDKVKVGIFGEIKALNDAIKGKLFENDVQRELNHAWERLEILEKLYNFSLTKEDALFYFNNRDDFKIGKISSFINAHRNKLDGSFVGLPDNLHEIDENLKQVERFYIYALRRDEALMENMLRKMDATGEKAAIMVTGGFHTPGIKRLMREKGISYVVLSPSIDSKLDKRKEALLYERAMTGNVRGLERVLKSLRNIARHGKIDDPRYFLQRDTSFPTLPGNQMEGDLNVTTSGAIAMEFIHVFEEQKRAPETRSEWTEETLAILDERGFENETSRKLCNVINKPFELLEGAAVKTQKSRNGGIVTLVKTPSITFQISNFPVSGTLTDYSTVSSLPSEIVRFDVSQGPEDPEKIFFKVYPSDVDRLSRAASLGRVEEIQAKTAESVDVSARRGIAADRDRFTSEVLLIRHRRFAEFMNETILSLINAKGKKALEALDEEMRINLELKLDDFLVGKFPTWDKTIEWYLSTNESDRTHLAIFIDDDLERYEKRIMRRYNLEEGEFEIDRSKYEGEIEKTREECRDVFLVTAISRDIVLEIHELRKNAAAFYEELSTADNERVKTIRDEAETLREKLEELARKQKVLSENESVSAQIESLEKAIEDESDATTKNHLSNVKGKLDEIAPFYDLSGLIEKALSEMRDLSKAVDDKKAELEKEAEERRRRGEEAERRRQHEAEVAARRRLEKAKAQAIEDLNFLKRILGEIDGALDEVEPKIENSATISDSGARRNALNKIKETIGTAKNRLEKEIKPEDITLPEELSAGNRQELETAINNINTKKNELSGRIDEMDRKLARAELDHEISKVRDKFEHDRSRMETSLDVCETDLEGLENRAKELKNETDLDLREENIKEIGSDTESAEEDLKQIKPETIDLPQLELPNELRVRERLADDLKEADEIVRTEIEKTIKREVVPAKKQLNGKKGSNKKAIKRIKGLLKKEKQNLESERERRKTSRKGLEEKIKKFNRIVVVKQLALHGLLANLNKIKERIKAARKESDLDGERRLLADILTDLSELETACSELNVPEGFVFPEGVDPELRAEFEDKVAGVNGINSGKAFLEAEIAQVKEELIDNLANVEEELMIIEAEDELTLLLNDALAAIEAAEIEQIQKAIKESLQIDDPEKRKEDLVKIQMSIVSAEKALGLIAPEAIQIEEKPAEVENEIADLEKEKQNSVRAVLEKSEEDLKSLATQAEISVEEAQLEIDQLTDALAKIESAKNGLIAALGEINVSEVENLLKTANGEASSLGPKIEALKNAKKALDAAKTRLEAVQVARIGSDINRNEIDSGFVKQRINDAVMNARGEVAEEGKIVMEKLQAMASQIKETEKTLCREKATQTIKTKESELKENLGKIDLEPVRTKLTQAKAQTDLDAKKTGLTSAKELLLTEENKLNAVDTDDISYDKPEWISDESWDEISDDIVTASRIAKDEIEAQKTPITEDIEALKREIEAELEAVERAIQARRRRILTEEDAKAIIKSLKSRIQHSLARRMGILGDKLAEAEKALDKAESTDLGAEDLEGAFEEAEQILAETGKQIGDKLERRIYTWKRVRHLIRDINKNREKKRKEPLPEPGKKDIRTKIRPEIGAYVKELNDPGNKRAPKLKANYQEHRNKYSELEARLNALRPVMGRKKQLLKAQNLINEEFGKLTGTLGDILAKIHRLRERFNDEAKDENKLASERLSIIFDIKNAVSAIKDRLDSISSETAIKDPADIDSDEFTEEMRPIYEDYLKSVRDAAARLIQDTEDKAADLRDDCDDLTDDIIDELKGRINLSDWEKRLIRVYTTLKELEKLKADKSYLIHELREAETLKRFEELRDQIGEWQGRLKKLSDVEIIAEDGVPPETEAESVEVLLKTLVYDIAGKIITERQSLEQDGKDIGEIESKQYLSLMEDPFKLVQRIEELAEEIRVLSEQEDLTDALCKMRVLRAKKKEYSERPCLKNATKPRNSLGERVIVAETKITDSFKKIESELSDLKDEQRARETKKADEERANNAKNVVKELKTKKQGSINKRLDAINKKLDGVRTKAVSSTRADSRKGRENNARFRALLGELENDVEEKGKFFRKLGVKDTEIIEDYIGTMAKLRGKITRLKVKARENQRILRARIQAEKLADELAGRAEKEKSACNETLNEAREHAESVKGDLHIKNMAGNISKAKVLLRDAKILRQRIEIIIAQIDASKNGKLFNTINPTYRKRAESALDTVNEAISETEEAIEEAEKTYGAVRKAADIIDKARTKQREAAREVESIGQKINAAGDMKNPDRIQDVIDEVNGQLEGVEAAQKEVEELGEVLAGIEDEFGVELPINVILDGGKQGEEGVTEVIDDSNETITEAIREAADAIAELETYQIEVQEYVSNTLDTLKQLRDDFYQDLEKIKARANAVSLEPSTADGSDGDEVIEYFESVRKTVEKAKGLEEEVKAVAQALEEELKANEAVFELAPENENIRVIKEELEQEIADAASLGRVANVLGLLSVKKEDALNKSAALCAVAAQRAASESESTFQEVRARIGVALAGKPQNAEELESFQREVDSIKREIEKEARKDTETVAGPFHKLSVVKAKIQDIREKAEVENVSLDPQHESGVSDAVERRKQLLAEVEEDWSKLERWAEARAKLIGENVFNTVKARVGEIDSLFGRVNRSEERIKSAKFVDFRSEQETFIPLKDRIAKNLKNWQRTNDDVSTTVNLSDELNELLGERLSEVQTEEIIRPIGESKRRFEKAIKKAWKAFADKSVEILEQSKDKVRSERDEISETLAGIIEEVEKGEMNYTQLEEKLRETNQLKSELETLASEKEKVSLDPDTVRIIGEEKAKELINKVHQEIQSDVDEVINPSEDKDKPTIAKAVEIINGQLTEREETEVARLKAEIEKEYGEKVEGPVGKIKSELEGIGEKATEEVAESLRNAEGYLTRVPKTIAVPSSFLAGHPEVAEKVSETNNKLASAREEAESAVKNAKAVLDSKQAEDKERKISEAVKAIEDETERVIHQITAGEIWNFDEVNQLIDREISSNGIKPEVDAGKLEKRLEEDMRNLSEGICADIDLNTLAGGKYKDLEDEDEIKRALASSKDKIQKTVSYSKTQIDAFLLIIRTIRKLWLKARRVIESKKDRFIGDIKGCHKEIKEKLNTVTELESKNQPQETFRERKKLIQTARELIDSDKIETLKTEALNVFTIGFEITRKDLGQMDIRFSQDVTAQTLHEYMDVINEHALSAEPDTFADFIQYFYEAIVRGDKTIMDSVIKGREAINDAVEEAETEQKELKAKIRRFETNIIVEEIKNLRKEIVDDVLEKTNETVEKNLEEIKRLENEGRSKTLPERSKLIEDTQALYVFKDKDGNMLELWEKTESECENRIQGIIGADEEGQDIQDIRVEEAVSELRKRLKRETATAKRYHEELNEIEEKTRMWLMFKFNPVIREKIVMPALEIMDKFKGIDNLLEGMEEDLISGERIEDIEEKLKSARALLSEIQNKKLERIFKDEEGMLEELPRYDNIDENSLKGYVEYLREFIGNVERAAAVDKTTLDTANMTGVLMDESSAIDALCDEKRSAMDKIDDRLKAARKAAEEAPADTEEAAAVEPGDEAAAPEVGGAGDAAVAVEPGEMADPSTVVEEAPEKTGHIGNILDEVTRIADESIIEFDDLEREFGLTDEATEPTEDAIRVDETEEISDEEIDEALDEFFGSSLGQGSDGRSLGKSILERDFNEFHIKSSEILKRSMKQVKDVEEKKEKAIEYVLKKHNRSPETEDGKRLIGRIERKLAERINRILVKGRASRKKIIVNFITEARKAIAVLEKRVEDADTDKLGEIKMAAETLDGQISEKDTAINEHFTDVVIDGKNAADASAEIAEKMKGLNERISSALEQAEREGISKELDAIRGEIAEFPGITSQALEEEFREAMPEPEFVKGLLKIENAKLRRDDEKLSEIEASIGEIDSRLKILEAIIEKGKESSQQGLGEKFKRFFKKSKSDKEILALGKEAGIIANSVNEVIEASKREKQEREEERVSLIEEREQICSEVDGLEAEYEAARTGYLKELSAVKEERTEALKESTRELIERLDAITERHDTQAVEQIRTKIAAEKGTVRSELQTAKEMLDEAEEAFREELVYKENLIRIKAALNNTGEIIQINEDNFEALNKSIEEQKAISQNKKDTFLEKIEDEFSRLSRINQKLEKLETALKTEKSYEGNHFEMVFRRGVEGDFEEEKAQIKDYKAKIDDLIEQISGLKKKIEEKRTFEDGESEKASGGKLTFGDEDEGIIVRRGESLGKQLARTSEVLNHLIEAIESAERLDNELALDVITSKLGEAVDAYFDSIGKVEETSFIVYDGREDLVSIENIQRREYWDELLDGSSKLKIVVVNVPEGVKIPDAVTVHEGKVSVNDIVRDISDRFDGKVNIVAVTSEPLEERGENMFELRYDDELRTMDWTKELAMMTGKKVAQYGEAALLKLQADDEGADIDIDNHVINFTRASIRYLLKQLLQAEAADEKALRSA